MASIFLSHSSKDKVFTEDLAGRLRVHGIEVWLDDMDLDIGDSLVQRIGDAIEAADYVGVVISGSSVQSAWVKHELQLAYSREIESERVVVLPILIEACKLPSYMRGKKYADFTNPSAADESFTKLLRAVQKSPLEEHPRKNADFPVYQYRNVRGRARLVVVLAVALASFGLTRWWRTPPLAYWQSPPRVRATPLQNTVFVREIRSIGSAEIRDTLVWQFALAERPTCLRVHILQSVNLGDWDPRPVAEQEHLDPSYRNFSITGFPPERVATIGVILKGSPPRDCLRLSVWKKPDTVIILEGPLVLARLRRSPVLLFLVLFATGSAMVALATAVMRRIRVPITRS
jgi:hypothetical protein